MKEEWEEEWAQAEEEVLAEGLEIAEEEVVAVAEEGVKMLELTDQNFEQEVLRSEKPVLVDFWSPTCPPCLILGPIIEEIAKEFEDKAKVGKLNVFENPETAEKYQIVGIPTIIIFKNGEIKERTTGVKPKQVIVDKLNLLL